MNAGSGEDLQRTQFVIDTSESPHVELRPIALDDVVIRRGFWDELRQIRLETALKHGYEKLVESGVVDNFHAAAAGTGAHKGTWFADSDLYKWLEAMAYATDVVGDTPLYQSMLDAISIIGKAQCEDGYLNTFFQLTPSESRWTNMAAGHELYCAGHLIQAAVANFRMTGANGLLSTAIRFADHIDRVFGDENLRSVPGHPVIESALVEMYRVTRDSRYLSLAQFFVDQRGYGLIGGEPHHQDATPVRRTHTVQGHAVRQLYLLSGVTDIYQETGEKELWNSLVHCWHDMATKKMGVHGGAGTTPKLKVVGGFDHPFFRGEGFSVPYDLPNFPVHFETCAQVASFFWNWRMLTITSDAVYSDLMERVLYNGILSGISLDGTRFAYVNPLSSPGDIERHPWFSVACCPTNVMRLIASIPSYVATRTDEGLQVHLYAACSIESRDNGNTAPIRMDVDTDYPWSERVSFTIRSSPGRWELQLRIPAWCSDPSVRINHEDEVRPEAGTYHKINRAWKDGDTVELVLPMKPRAVEAHPYVDSASSAVAFMRGPLLYCFEEIDQPDHVDVHSVRLQYNGGKEIAISERPSRVHNDTIELLLPASARDMSRWDNTLYRTISQNDEEEESVTLVAVPYFAWANRGASRMRVWMNR